MDDITASDLKIIYKFLATYHDDSVREETINAKLSKFLDKDLSEVLSTHLRSRQEIRSWVLVSTQICKIEDADLRNQAEKVAKSIERERNSVINSPRGILWRCILDFSHKYIRDNGLTTVQFLGATGVITVKHDGTPLFENGNERAYYRDFRNKEIYFVVKNRPELIDKLSQYYNNTQLLGIIPLRRNVDVFDDACAEDLYSLLPSRNYLMLHYSDENSHLPTEGKRGAVVTIYLDVSQREKYPDILQKVREHCSRILPDVDITFKYSETMFC